ncbi:MAG: hypothetical protein RB191_17035, partial [Terriglobia bacterium]|nr:hypothetical protein [Terriglobia bacterium]
MTGIAWVWFVLVVSVLSLVAAWLLEYQILSTYSGTLATRPIAAESRQASTGGRMKTHLFSSRWVRFASVITTFLLIGAGAAFAEPAAQVGGEANLQLPDLSQVRFFGHPGIDGHSLLMYGPLFCILGMIFGIFMYVHLKGMPAHKSMLEVSQLI